MKRIIAIILALTLAFSIAACAKKEGTASSSEEQIELAGDKTQLAEKIKECEPLIYGNANEQTRKYLKGAVDNAKLRYEDKKCSADQMEAAISDMNYAVSILKEGSFEAISVSGLAAFPTAERATAPDGTANAVKFTDSFDMVAASAPFGSSLTAADGITLRFEAQAPSGELAVTLKAGASLFTANLPVPAVATDLRISFDYFTNPDGQYLIDVLSAVDGFAVSASGVCFISNLAAYSETLEAAKSALSVYTASSVSNDKFYKITDVKTGLVLTYGPEITESKLKWEETLVNFEEGQSLTFTDDSDSITQLWQIYKAGDGNYKIINKGTGLALTTNVELDLFASEIDMMNSKQNFGIKSLGGGTFALTYVDAYSVQPFSKKAILKDGTNHKVKLTEYNYGSWELVKADEFEGDKLDESMWYAVNGKTRGDTEPIYYRDNEKNYRVENGNLVITTLIEEYEGYHATSASIESDGKYGISYGRVDVRAKLPAGQFLWPAIWMMGTERLWPHDGEIDIMENGWVDPEASANSLEASANLYGTLHWFGEEGRHMNKGYNFKAIKNGALSDDYHIYSVEWDSEQIRIYYDGMMYMSLLINNDSMRWGFGDHPHFLILNTSVAGPGNDQLPDGMPSKGEYFIDYVRFYKRSGEISVTDNISSGADTMGKMNANGNRGLATAASPDGKYLATVGWSNVVLIYDAKNMSQVSELHGGGSVYTELTFSPDGKTLVAGSRDGVLTFVEMDTLISWDVPNTHVYHDALAFTSDSQYLITGGRNYDDMPYASRKMSVFTASGTPVKTVTLQSDIRNIASAGNVIALALADSTVQLYSASDFGLMATLTGHATAVRGIDITADGSRVVTSDEKGNILIWDTASKQRIGKMNNTCNASVTMVKFLDGGRRVAAASNSGDVRIFTVSTGRLYSLMGGFESLVRDIDVSEDGKYIAACAYDGSVRTYRSDGTLLEAVDLTEQNGSWIETVSIGGNNNRLIVGCDYNGGTNILCKLSKK